MTGTSKKVPKVTVLDMVPCIRYPVQFRKDKGKNVLALLNSRSEVNAMTPTYTVYLGLKVGVTNISVQKINEFSLATYDISIAALQIVDKLDCFWFF